MSESKPAQKTNPTLKATVSVMAGAIAGGIEATAVWPMESLKTQLQLMEKAKDGKKPPFTGIFDGLTWNVKNHGFMSLYRGLAPTLIGSIPKGGIRFGSNAYFKKQLADEKGKLTPGKNFLAGMMAGVSEAILAVTPIETVKTKLIQSNSGMITGIKNIIAQDGIAGLYQGLMATILKQGSNHGLRFMFFNEYKRIVTDDGKTKLSALQSLFGGMMAGTFSTLGNNPFDVLKTRMQGLDAKKYKSTTDCAMKILTQEGPMAFYRGTIPRLARVIPGQGIIFMSFESIELFLYELLDE